MILNNKIHPFRIFIFIISFFLLIGTPQVTIAQTVSPIIMQQINAELARRGLNEGEVRTRLLKEGIDIDNIQPVDLPDYQDRITAILDDMEEEKNAVAVAVAEPEPEPEPVTQVTVDDEDIKEAISTNEEDFAVAVEKVVKQSVPENEGPAQIYGHALFTNNTLDVYTTTEGAYAPESYILGPGDEIRVSIFGASQTDLHLIINSEGSVQPAGMQKIFLEGLSLKQTRALMYKRLSIAYTFKSDQFALTIITARTILVNIFGETNITGGFTISALNSAFNALSAAGGPTDIGSVRDIQIIRGQSRQVLDLYVFMNNPTVQFKFDLQQNDVIYVPVAQKIVNLVGAVKRQMRYEMLPKETLIDLIRYAGGLNENVYPEFIQIQRYVSGEIRLLEYDLSKVLSGKEIVKLKDGDIVTIKAIEKPIENYVEITGSVHYPGAYDIIENNTLNKLLSKAKFKKQARKDFLVVERLRPDETIDVLTLPWSELQDSDTTNKIHAKNMHGTFEEFILQPQDKIIVYDESTFVDRATISVLGDVRIPFEQIFALGDTLSLKNAIELSGGLNPSAYNIAYVFRNNPFTPGQTEYIRINLETDNHFILKPGDQLNVYSKILFVKEFKVSLMGAVERPREFNYSPSIKLQDLITASGGYALGADLKKVEVFRINLSFTEEFKLEMLTLTLDTNYNVLSPSNFKLQPYDKVVIRTVPGFNMGREVTMEGEVKYPGHYVLSSKQTHLSELIVRAGGLMQAADLRGSRLFRKYQDKGYITFDIKKAMRNQGNVKFDPYLFAGDLIIVARLENTISINPEGTKLQSVLGGEKLNVVYQGHKSARWYLNNYAGGFAERADKKNLVVINLNGQVLRTKSFLGIRNYPNLDNGSEIRLTMKPPKVKKERTREKTSWGDVFTATLSALTIGVTTILLVQQMNP